MEGLEKLHLVHARLLFIIAEMFKDGKITDTQKLLLKQCVFQDDDQIFQTYETFSEPSKIDALVEALRNLAIRLEPLQGDK